VIITPEQQEEHAEKLQQYFALSPKRDLAKAILLEELNELGNFEQAIEAATRRLKHQN
jgi:hypothetical protein